ncbi:hypothetical protein D9756_011414 [Leucocoprinus leucothites]|uniref:Helitron helicase-like domain-containing protein n=1 Tax=Leucocoprinus leucothites TaxID=201217 RepID=A0A8H5FQC1_9AGAR|nr:hypothetical protein D9756_011414 [Leucoagaricus leucothites]
MHAASVWIPHTDAALYALRSFIWSDIAACGPLSLWITLNPLDIHNPVAQVLAGQDIDLDKFDNEVGPSSMERAANIAKDLVAGSLYCHHVMQAVLEGLFGIKGVQRGSHVHRQPGVLGLVEGYVGMIEAQGWGTLHLHIIMWLTNTPMSSKLAAALQTIDFQERVAKYIATCIHADIDKLSDEAVRHIPKDCNIGYN